MAGKKSPHAVMLNLTIGHWIARLIHVAAKLRLADLLKDGPRTARQLAESSRVQAPALYRVLRALASVGIFAETTGGRFKLTPLAATLRSDAPGSLRAWALTSNERYTWESWLELLHGVTSAEVPFVKAHGVPPFQYLEEHPDDLAVFGAAMTSLSMAENPAVAAAYKFTGTGTVVDVGGGHGSLLAAILRANPKWKGVLFDQASVIDHARKDRHVTAPGIAGRCTLESGSFFESMPPGADAYVMKYILHDWNDEQCLKILANCRAAMNAKGRVLVVETVIPPGNGPDWGKLLDIQMLVIGGRERTKKEFAALFAAAGLKLKRVVRTKCPLRILEATR